jgi:hypothetical protein
MTTKQMKKNVNNITKKTPVRFCYCNFPGCKTCREAKGTLHFGTISVLAGIHRTKNNPVVDRNKTRKRHAIRAYLRCECLRHIGKDKNDESKDYRICSDHKVIAITRQINWTTTNNKTKTEMVRLYFPEKVGIESNLNDLETTTRRNNGGIGNSRTRKSTMESVQQRLDDGDKVTTWAWHLTQLVDRSEWESTMDR